jgi:hypothetical protein
MDGASINVMLSLRSTFCRRMSYWSVYVKRKSFWVHRNFRSYSPMFVLFFQDENADMSLSELSGTSRWKNDEGHYQ